MCDADESERDIEKTSKSRKMTKRKNIDCRIHNQLLQNKTNRTKTKKVSSFSRLHELFFKYSNGARASSFHIIFITSTLLCLDDDTTCRTRQAIKSDRRKGNERHGEFRSKRSINYRRTAHANRA